MSEAWHQHLNNLTLWEQIDRFFNPWAYSCTSTGPPQLILFMRAFQVFLFGTAILVLSYAVWRFWKTKTGDTGSV